MNAERPVGQWLVPLRRWQVSNFKSIKDADLELRPLTFLVGANSSGKTSFLQSLLLVVQAAQGGAEGSALPLNGPLVTAGRFEDARLVGSDEPIVLGGTYGPDRDLPAPGGRGHLVQGLRRTPGWMTGFSVTWLAQFDGSAPENNPGAARLVELDFKAQPSDLASELEELEEEGPVHLRARRKEPEDGADEAELRLRRGLMAAKVRGEFETGFTGSFEAGTEERQVRGLWVRASLPFGFVTPRSLREVAAITWVKSRGSHLFWAPPLGVGVGAAPWHLPRRRRDPDQARLNRLAEVAAGEILSWATAQDDQIDLARYLSRDPARDRHSLTLEDRAFLREYPEALVRAIAERLDLSEEVYLPPEDGFAELIHEAALRVHRFLRERVAYLGPLRQDPQVVYKTAPMASTGFIGTKGEYTAAVLHMFGSRQVQGFDASGTPEITSLVEAVGRWAKRLDMADAVETADLARLGIQISVKRGAVGPVDITSVGVGVSQLLPVIVMCLTAEPGTLILLEQPELHLHPAMQQRLADFLLACARSGRQLLVETHSEYLVSRLRRRIAEDQSNELVENVALYYVEQVNDQSHFRRVPINKYGALEEWPKGFFDQAATDSRALLEAGLAKRSRRGKSD